jgi:SAM-dependent methyltransferase
MTNNQTKQNIERFNQDIHANNGYLYTTNAPYSAIKSNERINRAIFAAIPAQSKRIIDLGCGDGVATAELAKAFPLAYVEAIDPAHIAIEMAIKRFPHITFRVANILDHPTQPTTMFDTAMFRGVIHHLADDTQQTAIQNARTFANSLIIIEPNGDNPILKLIEKSSAYHKTHEEQSFTSDTLIDWCVAAGWKEISVNYIGFVPFFFPEILARIIYFFQPLLERIPIINKYFSAQIVVVCRA